MVTPRVKICGITRPEDARLAADLGASAVGFLFWPESPRFIRPEIARSIVDTLPASVVAIGVFVNQEVPSIHDAAATARLGAVQLHGDEGSDVMAAMLLPVVRAVTMDDGFDPVSLDAIPPEVTVLLDAHDPAKRGGTGRTVDWTLASRAAARRPVILAGGLTPDNIAAAIVRVRPYGVDVSSGVESSPGIKDPEKLRALFAAVNQAAMS